MTSRRSGSAPRPNAARTFIRDSKCFCTYECFLTINILFNPRMLLSVAKEWAILKARRYARRLFGAPPDQTTAETIGRTQPAGVAAAHQPPPGDGAA